MASTSRSFCRGLRCVSRNTPAKRKCVAPFAQHQRYASSNSGSKIKKPIYFNDIDSLLQDTGINRARVSADTAESLRPLYDPQPDEYLVPEEPLKVADLDPEERADYEALPKDQQDDYLARLNHFKAFSESPLTDGVETFNKEQYESIVNSAQREFPVQSSIPRAFNPASGAGFWADDESDEFGQEPDNDDKWDSSMITTVAENELQLHREIRQYTRVVAWEMPLLAKYAKPLTPPTHATPLRFRYTTYMGETHPATRKVVLSFTATDLATSLKLTSVQKSKLTKILGTRYNPTTDVAHMSCEKFPNAVQNKRYLGDLLQSLVTAAKDPSDTFDDIPLDARHVKTKKKFPFPQEWLLTEKRVGELAEERKMEIEAAERKERGQARNERDEKAQGSVARYVQRMQLGKGRDGGLLGVKMPPPPPQGREAEGVEEKVPVQVR